MRRTSLPLLLLLGACSYDAEDVGSTSAPLSAEETAAFAVARAEPDPATRLRALQDTADRLLAERVRAATPVEHSIPAEGDVRDPEGEAIKRTNEMEVTHAAIRREMAAIVDANEDAFERVIFEAPRLEETEGDREVNRRFLEAFPHTDEAAEREDER